MHSSVESNEMLDIYKGNITTDAAGNATVTLPDYFMTLNKDYSYQLTCIGQFAQAIIFEKINGNHFSIKTDKPSVEVSWEVQGVRQDPVANKYRIQNVVDKPAGEKGTYLNPEAYGQPREMSAAYRHSGMVDPTKNRNKIQTPMMPPRPQPRQKTISAQKQ